MWTGWSRGKYTLFYHYFVSVDDIHSFWYTCQIGILADETALNIIDVVAGMLDADIFDVGKIFHVEELEIVVCHPVCGYSGLFAYSQSQRLPLVDFNAYRDGSVSVRVVERGGCLGEIIRVCVWTVCVGGLTEQIWQRSGDIVCIELRVASRRCVVLPCLIARADCPCSVESFTFDGVDACWKSSDLLPNIKWT